ncbi:class I SAM-dependent methyltransferase [Photobacterium sp. BZF1]|uniref:class I SAM-dependent methyltransferase n=1 Tax=Photobacterium sp. BZF1 TaxID=1904457 RepID=UPI0016539454|nr:class I SAM-dependent methyltransferase [Photobacterium sp. BZF1]MBC7005374.1 class I SAM-dependent methyltransferase [Photobacterium sp. BZF1]
MQKNFYHNNASQLASDYQKLAFEDVHASWEPHWPIADDTGKQPRVLDIGAGSGRDALWFAENGCEVYAVEPAQALRTIGKQHTQSTEVVWLDDILPELKKVISLGIRFDYILLSAVWMHIPRSERNRAFRKLSNLLAPNGKLIITLRHGDFDDGRVNHGVSAEEIEQLAKERALHVCLKTELNKDAMGRNSVQWQTMVLSKPESISQSIE